MIHECAAACVWRRESSFVCVNICAIATMLTRRSLGLVRCARVRSFSTAPQAGVLHICGTGESNKLGVGDTRDRETPTVVEALKDVPIVQVACGKYHTAALSADGDVYAWGLESSGQLGLGSRSTKASTPVKVDGLCGRGITQLSCGMYHTLALTAEGEVYSCGFGGSFFNGAGGLGHGNRTQLESFTRLSAFGGSDSTTGVAAATVSAGGYHSLARDVNGGVWTWGRGEWGRLGHGDAGDCLEPTRVEGVELDLPAVSKASVGESHCGCLVDGIVYTWGRNEQWQLGYEVAGLLNAGQSLDAQQDPHAVELPEEAAPITHLACGEQGTVALAEDGAIWVCGMSRFFEPTRLRTDGLEGEIVDIQVGANHVRSPQVAHPRNSLHPSAADRLPLFPSV
jgi:alpha-tubulin suppressor-like RCC1 family protein